MFDFEDFDVSETIVTENCIKKWDIKKQKVLMVKFSSSPKIVHRKIGNH